jgi:hypothetical protein
MTEIQLKNIVERLQSEEKYTKTDGDETMIKNVWCVQPSINKGALQL